MDKVIQSSAEENQLASEASPYLRSASHQPVHWYPWGEQAFSVAQKENKPILLDIGAVWCHWCHVMDTESYENEATARIINDNFVSVKVDRDERPDVDARYQAAVSALSGQGGWPLTAFLTPDGQVYFGGTYFPPEDRYGRIGFPKVLTLLAEAFRKEPDKVSQNAEQVRHALQQRWAGSRPSRPASDSTLDDALAAILNQVDGRHGGFGSAPKFPHCSAIELFLSRYDRSKDTRLLDAVTLTLRKMALGGVYDQLGGGFHRYSTDESWIVPHFEKMLYDNAPLLTNYVHTYQATGDAFFRNVALDIVRFADTVLSDRDKGGFFGSQDADVAPGDDGSFFTWSLEETRKVLDDDEFEVIQLYFGISSTGQMHGDRSQNVLHVEKDAEEIAASLRKPTSEIVEITNSARRKMLAVRSARKSPFVDETIYADWNGMMVCAYLEAFKAFRQDELLQFALKTLDRILTEHLKSDGTITHRAASLAPEGFLGDQVEIANALLQAFEVTAERHYLENAESLMHRTMEFFWDQDQGGFFDIPAHQRGRGLLSIGTKPVQDSPVAGANSVAISVLNRLWVLTNQPDYRTFAEESVNHFSGMIGDESVFSSRFYLALDEFLHPPPHIVVVSDSRDKLGKHLFDAALSTYRPGKTVTSCEPTATSAMPEMLRKSMKSFSRPVALVCSQFSCAPPAYDSDTLISIIESFGRG